MRWLINRQIGIPKGIPGQGREPLLGRSRRKQHRGSGDQTLGEQRRPCPSPAQPRFRRRGTRQHGHFHRIPSDVEGTDPDVILVAALSGHGHRPSDHVIIRAHRHRVILEIGWNGPPPDTTRHPQRDPKQYLLRFGLAVIVDLLHGGVARRAIDLTAQPVCRLLQHRVAVRLGVAIRGIAVPIAHVMHDAGLTKTQAHIRLAAFPLKARRASSGGIEQLSPWPRAAQDRLSGCGRQVRGKSWRSFGFFRLGQAGINSVGNASHHPTASCGEQ